MDPSVDRLCRLADGPFRQEAQRLTAVARAASGLGRPTTSTTMCRPEPRPELLVSDPRPGASQEWSSMPKVTAQMSVSLDGFYAGPMHVGGPADWMASAEAAGFFRVTQWVLDAEAWRDRLGFEGGEQNTNSDIIAETWAAAGAYVMGRRMADGGLEPWGEVPPFRAPVFVVTHRPQEKVVRQGGTSFTYVTDGIASAINQARAAAGGKNVAVAGGGRLLRQVLREGLLDELELHIAPVVLGSGMRLLDADLGLADMEAIELSPTRVVHTPDITHIRYTVIGRRGLTPDSRSSGELARAGDER